mmetsp:Transcript_12959/g.27791  ORF Transcript_12959/g.27791 Transcript_12959/m.27791 type:complete len:2710 (-) Transcript_12959:932-9061(-)
MFNLRRPVPCPAGTYCAPGTASASATMKNFTTPQPCFENFHCPEGTTTPQGFGGCPIGHYCPLGIKTACPLGTYCPTTGMDRPLPCPPSTFNGMLGQTTCTKCPAGFFCPGYGRLVPILCSPGYICSTESLSSPNGICPAGFYCPSGTLTNDPFRNDTTLRPYPCSAGSYCAGGVGYDRVVIGNFLYAQPCAESMFCELGSTSPKGSGLCPKGFYCPQGTGAPIPTNPGTFSEVEGTVQAAMCLPGYYAPTIETVVCYPCPPGTQCVNDGTAEALICPPGTYKTKTEPGESVVCRGCPAGTWSKNWELSDDTECTSCPPGVTCPMDGMSFPCALSDLPTPYTPTTLGESERECLSKGKNFFFGYINCPVDDRGRGPKFQPSNDPPGTELILNCEGEDFERVTTAQCYRNSQPIGSKVYERMRDYHGPLYEIQSGGVYHQGYGDQFYEGHFGRGSKTIEHPVTESFFPARNCTPGYFYYNSSTRTEVWLPGSCEADLICAYNVKPEAQPCSEGYVCGMKTNAVNALDVQCSEGFVCDFGTTQDTNLVAPQGRYSMLCDAGYYCEEGTGSGQANSKPCPPAYFCPTGTGNPYTGSFAADAVRRYLDTDTSNPFLDYLYVAMWDPIRFEPRNISAHDDRCFKGINQTLMNTIVTRYTDDGVYDGEVSLATENNLVCARDHKWRLVSDAVSRERCDCNTQKERFQKVFALWQCTKYNIQSACDKLLDGEFKVKFSYNLLERQFIYSRKLCFQTLDDSVSCVYDENPSVEDPNAGGGVDTVDTNSTRRLEGDVMEGCYERGDMDCLCGPNVLYQWSKEREDLCKLFKFRSDPGRAKRTTEFRSYDDLKSFIYNEEGNTKEEDEIKNIGPRLAKVHGSMLSNYNPYDGVFFKQLDIKLFCELTEECTYIDTLVYDLWAAIKFIDEFGNRTAELLESERLDTCLCQDMTRCPDGTITAIGATNIYDCSKTGNEVLVRIMPLSPDSSPEVNMSGWEYTTKLTGRKVQSHEKEEFGEYQLDNIAGVGKLNLKAWQVAVITMDLSHILRNFTYNDHYQLSVYFDCTPCKIRYVCRTTEGEDTPECCKCKRAGLPYYFKDDHREPADYPDNKHALVQVSISPLRDLQVVFVLELLHGLYYGAFNDITPKSGDVVIHTPNRANYGTTDQFVALLLREDVEDMSLPMNLPLSMVSTSEGIRKAGELYDVENDAFMDRIARVHIGDPTYGKGKTTSAPTEAENTTRRRLQEGTMTLEELLGNSDENDAVPFGEEPLEYVARDKSTVWMRDSGWWDYVDGDGADFFALHYLPFFSNCREYDSHIYISKLLEMHPAPHCEHIPFGDTINVRPYPWEEQMNPHADFCRLPPDELDRMYADEPFCIDAEDCESKEGEYPGMRMSCVFEEDIFIPASKPRWFESGEGTALFHLTKYPVKLSDFRTDEELGEKWGRRSALGELIGTENLIPIEIAEEGGSEEFLVPRRIFFHVSYFQYEQGQKSIVGGEIKFDDLCTITDNPATLKLLEKRDPPIYRCAEGDYNYMLFFRWDPMGWGDLINTFQFSWDVYAMFFTVVGIFSSLVGFVLWLISRILTRLKHPPPFKFFSFYRIVAYPSAYGVLLSSVPIAFGVGLFHAWFILLSSTDPIKLPSSINFEWLSGHFQDSLMLTAENQQRYRMGRIGTSLIVLSVYLMMYSAVLVVPENRFDQRVTDDRVKFGQKNTDPEEFLEEHTDENGVVQGSDLWKPRFWKRAHIILASGLESMALLIMFEFSYSNTFETYVMEFLVGMKVLGVMLESYLEKNLRDILVCAPFIIVVQVSEMTVTMGASDFIDFVSSYVVELGLMLVERLVMAPLLAHTILMWPKWKIMIRRRFTKRRKMSRDQRAKEEAEWKKVNEQIALEREGVEPLLKSYATYATSVEALMLCPYVNIFLIVFNKVTEIPGNYGIRETDLVYYFLFSFLIIPFTLAMDMFILNTQELIQGFKIYEYVAYQQYRFGVRENRWQMDADTLDESIAPPLQTIDNLCFSSQYYFIAGLHAWAILLFVFGLTVQVRNKYNLFADPLFPLLLIIVVCMCSAANRIGKMVGNRLKIWKLKPLEGTVDDDIAAKLKVGAGRQEDLEQERLELQAMNSERFRHRFMDRNRPWILQHLSELLTPRTLQMPGPDGRPNIEYIRDVYNDLMTMGEGKRRMDDARGDISSDDEDEMEIARRNWSTAPLTQSSRLIAKHWLEKARQRRAFFKLVIGYIKKQTGDVCEQCGRNQQSGVHMHAELAGENKQQDPKALDRLIAEYEAIYPGKSFDGALWQAYFRGHATFITRCQVCLDQQRQAEIAKKRAAQRGPGAGRVARAVDISSDEDDEVDDEVYEPVIVSRTSVEGKAVLKWLIAARKRLGGDFPRPDAREQMQEYANRMREAKIRREARKKQKNNRTAKVAGEGGRDAHGGDSSEKAFGQVHLNAASTALLQRWVRLARKHVVTRGKEKAARVREELDAVLEKMPEEDDWFFSAEFREEGSVYIAEGKELSEETYSLESEVEIKISEIEQIQEGIRLQINKEIDDASATLEQFIQEEKLKTIEQAEVRIQELSRDLQDKIELFNSTNRDHLSSADKTAAIKLHKDEVEEMELSIQNEREKQMQKLEARLQSRRQALRDEIADKRRNLQSKRRAADNEIIELQTALTMNIKPKETKWQQKAVIFTEKAKRKIAAKELEDAERQKQQPKQKRRRQTVKK